MPWGSCERESETPGCNRGASLVRSCRCVWLSACFRESGLAVWAPRESQSLHAARTEAEARARARAEEAAATKGALGGVRLDLVALLCLRVLGCSLLLWLCVAALCALLFLSAWLFVTVCGYV